jgi:hypothetical protein
MLDASWFLLLANCIGFERQFTASAGIPPKGVGGSFRSFY